MRVLQQQSLPAIDGGKTREYGGRRRQAEGVGVSVEREGWVGRRVPLGDGYDCSGSEGQIDRRPSPVALSAIQWVFHAGIAMLTANPKWSWPVGGGWGAVAVTPRTVGGDWETATTGTWFGVAERNACAWRSSSSSDCSSISGSNPGTSSSSSESPVSGGLRGADC